MDRGTEFGDLDRAILHALQVDARAPFRRIGDLLGVSDRTIARRYAWLRESRALRVIGVPDPAVTDGRQWLLHLQVTPDGATDIAEGLAARPDTSWVARCGGGTRIVGTVHGDGAGPLLLDTLVRSRYVVDVRADLVLRVFYGGNGQPFAKQGPLTADQIAVLTAHVPPVTGPPGPLDGTDDRILHALRHDGRATVDTIAASAAVSAATVRRRLTGLRTSGALRFEVDVDLQLMNLPVRTLLYAHIEPSHLPEAGRIVAAHRETGFAAATTGSDNLFASISTTGAPALYAYLTGKAGALPGLRATSLVPVLHTVKAAATRYGARPPR